MLDFRSDTVTQPCEKMREVMINAPVGDDVYGDDPTVNLLQEKAAEMMGFEEALLTPTGTQANLLALISHCERGDEYICGQQAHNYVYEGGGAASLGSVQPQPVENLADGSMDIGKMRAAIKSDDIHYARTRLISLENTISGKVLSLEYMAQVQELAFEHNLRMHLDGARIFNAATALDVDISKITQYFDSVSVCLSKGLGAPVGSLLLGSERFIEKARRWRKTCGGGMRQAGILAAAGLYALENNVERLALDHKNAHRLAVALNDIAGISVDIEQVQTNMVYALLDGIDDKALASFLKQRGVLISSGNPLRLVTHKDVTEAGIDALVQGITEFVASSH